MISAEAGKEFKKAFKVFKLFRSLFVINLNNMKTKTEASKELKKAFQIYEAFRIWELFSKKFIKFALKTSKLNK